MSRRKAFPIRHIVDRIPSEVATPNEIRRLRDAALTGLRDASFGTEIGRLNLTGKLTTAEVSTAKRWGELVNAYSVACRSPLAPRSVSFDAGGGHAADPNSEVGLREVKRHERTVAEWLAGRDVLRKAGRDVEAVVDHVVVQDRALAGYDELIALKAGLQALSTQWSAKRKAASARICYSCDVIFGWPMSRQKLQNFATAPPVI